MKRSAVHVTHEAVYKIGGIGAVLEGLLTSKRYQEAIDRTVLVNPLFSTSGPLESRLGPDGQVEYSSIDGLTEHHLAPQFQAIERAFNVHLVYGRRLFTDPGTGISAHPEVILVELTRYNAHAINRFKARLWERFKLESNQYEGHWDFEQYMRLAEPGLAAVAAIGAGGPDYQCTVLAHEYMGVPTALAAMLDDRHPYRTLFYAHEVAPMRRIVEEHPGHDTMFYNVLPAALAKGAYVQDVFGDQTHNYRYALVNTTRFLDNVLSVGDQAVTEMRFMGPAFADVHVDLVYNGIPAHRISLQEKRHAGRLLRQYCENLLGHQPDYVFSHVGRVVVSKGFWRDMAVLSHLETEFRKIGKTAVHFILCCEGAPRSKEDARHIERWWKWPVAHREGWPDLTGGEALIYAGVQEFNARSRNIKVVLVNQFGFTQERCGLRMPEEMDFNRLRYGADAEFGQSIYEPFGIAQLEPLSFGGVCVISDVCGCAGFVKAVASDRENANVVIADYTRLPKPRTFEQLLVMDRAEREAIEDLVARDAAAALLRRLPAGDEQTESLVQSGFEMAQRMSWDAVVSNYVLPAIARAWEKPR